MITKYYTYGSQDEPEGLTLGKKVFDEDGNLLCGMVYRGYKPKEITKAEYDQLSKKIACSRNEDLGLANGLISQKMINKRNEEVEALKEEQKKSFDNLIIRTKNKIQRMVDNNIILLTDDLYLDVLDEFEARLRPPAFTPSQVAQIAKDFVDQMTTKDEV